jgi:3-hydroxyisobutyrate dehydrogenase
VSSASAQRGGASPAFEGKASYSFAANDVTGKVWVSGISQKQAGQMVFGTTGQTVDDSVAIGGDIGAKNAALSIMVGGDAEAEQAVRPLFDCMGKTIVHQGAAGSGQHTKMVNQILIASGMIAVCEAMLYAFKSGLDAKTVLQSVSVGAAGSWSLQNLGPRIIDRNFEPGFFVEHFIKDMGIALAEAERMNLCLPGLALAKQLYEAVRAQGYGRKGTHALMLAMEHMCNVKR